MFSIKKTIIYLMCEQYGSELCFIASLDPPKVNGSIVICRRGTNARVEKGEAVLQAGGVGMILINSASTGNEIIADAHVLPATQITYSEGQTLLSYLKPNRFVHIVSYMLATCLETLRIS
jgi:PA domain